MITQIFSSFLYFLFILSLYHILFSLFIPPLLSFHFSPLSFPSSTSFFPSLLIPLISSLPSYFPFFASFPHFIFSIDHSSHPLLHSHLHSIFPSILPFRLSFLSTLPNTSPLLLISPSVSHTSSSHCFHHCSPLSCLPVTHREVGEHRGAIHVKSSSLRVEWVWNQHVLQVLGYEHQQHNRTAGGRADVTQECDDLMVKWKFTRLFKIEEVIK